MAGRSPLGKSDRLLRRRMRELPFCVGHPKEPRPTVSLWAESKLGRELCFLVGNLQTLRISAIHDDMIRAARKDMTKIVTIKS